MQAGGVDRYPRSRPVVQTVQNGMSILTRDGASRGELEAVAQVPMLGWDARTQNVDDT
jgi:hypothetical protein